VPNPSLLQEVAVRAPTRLPRPRRLLAGLGTLAVLAAGLVAVADIGVDAVECPPGTVPVAAHESLIVPPDQQDQLLPEYRGPQGVEFTTPCKPERVESFAEIAARNAQQDARISAPFAQPAPGARLAAAEQRESMLQQGTTVPGSSGTLVMHGQGPLNFDEDPYDAQQGLVDSTGRIDDFFYDLANNRLFAAIGTSGIWLSEDQGATWRSIGESLPTQVASAVSWSPRGGPDGTVVVLTGEHTFGGASFTGLGAFWSDDLGETWQRAEGPPDGTLGFAIEVDPANPDLVYAATGKGLFRSEDAGRTYEDVVLPVGECQGDYNIETCNYAHFVTDVVIKEPGGVGADTDGGTVLAAVGYRAGMLEDVSGEFIHSEGNGVYRSDTGEVGTFERLDGLDSAAGGRERLGRIEYGTAKGPDQDHDIVYAVVEDAVLFNGGVPIDPIPAGAPLGANPTVLNGTYASTDFGETWTQLADDQEMSTVCPVNQSAYCIPGLITPGAQSWYNMWIEPDPTRQIGGVPTRLVMGLEEVWQNRETQAPTVTPATSFQVIGSYFAGPQCLVGVACSDGDIPAGIAKTTHPDQHDGIFLPVLDEAGEPTGGIRLLVGHDGGLSSQTQANPEVEEFTQETWELEQENGLQTLLPYSVAVANDGTALQGLQDNGTALVDPTADLRQFEVQGADGTATAIDPEDSSYGYASSQGHGLLGVSSDRFLTFTDLNPPADNILFVPPFEMNPLNTDHVITGGTQVIENLAGREATSETWTTAIDLGTSEREPKIETDAPPPPRQTSATALYGDAAYVGYCAPCNILQTPYPYDSGIATNIGAPELPEPGTSTGWHVAAAEGLPERYVTDIAIDPYDPTARTVYASLGGYTRKWVPPGTGADEAEDVGEGHVFVSTDAGETFTDISGNLPDTPVLTVEQRGEQLLVGTDLGPFLSSDLEGTSWAPLAGSPAIPVMDIQMQADDPDTAYLAVYGRGVMRYTFSDDPVGTAEIRRLAGENREETAVRISEDVYEAADVVVVARSDQYADALAGAPLAADRAAPLLLTSSGELNPVVAAEVERLGAETAILLGGETALSPAVEQGLRDAGVTDVQRFGGTNRFATAAQIADELGATDQAWVVKGNDVDPTRGWPDAMSIGPVAATAGQPILLVETDRLPEETAAALGPIEAARLVGGDAAISPEVEAQVGALATLGDRVEGANRFATNVAAVQVGLEDGQGVESTWLARADAFADALAAGPSVAATGGSLVLVDSDSLEESLEAGAFLQGRACDIRLARLAGGELAIATSLEDELRTLLGGCATDGGIPDPPPQELVAGPSEDVPTEEPLPTEVLAGPFDFESDGQGWTPQVVVGANPSSMWRRAAPGNESGISYQVSPYTDAADARLLSPEIEVDGGEVAVTWAQAVDLEGGDFDNLFLEWSADGETWTELSKTGGTPDFPAFTPATVRFSPPAGTIQLRFRLVSDGICSTGTEASCGADSLEGAFVDDVTVLG
jgi:hypothetical protein